MSDPLPPLPVPARPIDEPRVSGVDAFGVVVADRSCRQCGYNVRGLHVGHQCPECGTAVAVSARGDGLEFCEPGWVRKLSIGGRMMVIGPTMMVLAIVGVLAFIFIGFAFLAFDNTFASSVLVGVMGCFVPIGLFGGALLAYIGMWYLTAREPLAFESSARSRHRVVVRVGLVMMLLSPVVSAIASRGGSSRAVEILLILVNLPITAFALIAVHHYYGWIGTLSARLSSAALESRCRMLATWVPIGMIPPTALSMIGSLTQALGRAGVSGATSSRSTLSNAEVLTSFFGCATCFSSLLLLGLFFVAMRVQTTIARSLREAAAEARRNWDGARSGGAAASPR